MAARNELRILCRKKIRVAARNRPPPTACKISVEDLVSFDQNLVNGRGTADMRDKLSVSTKVTKPVALKHLWNFLTDMARGGCERELIAKRHELIALVARGREFL
jgi:hypothetical protein